MAMKKFKDYKKAHSFWLKKAGLKPSGKLRKGVKQERYSRLVSEPVKKGKRKYHVHWRK